MKIIFKIIEYLPETEQVVVSFCRQNAPKSIDDLRKRLISRGQDSTDEIEKRLQTAINEINLKDRFDFVIYSDTKDIDYAKVREFYISKSIISN